MLFNYKNGSGEIETLMREELRMQEEHMLRRLRNRRIPMKSPDKWSEGQKSKTKLRGDFIRSAFSATVKKPTRNSGLLPVVASFQLEAQENLKKEDSPRNLQSEQTDAFNESELEGEKGESCSRGEEEEKQLELSLPGERHSERSISEEKQRKSITGKGLTQKLSRRSSNGKTTSRSGGNDKSANKSFLSSQSSISEGEEQNEKKEEDTQENNDLLAEKYKKIREKQEEYEDIIHMLRSSGSRPS